MNSPVLPKTTKFIPGYIGMGVVGEHPTSYLFAATCGGVGRSMFPILTYPINFY